MNLRALLVATAAFALLAPLLATAGTAGADTTPPVTTIMPDGIHGTNGWFRSNVEVRLVCTDNLQCGSTQYSVDGGVFSNYAQPFPVSGDGIHTVLASSKDTTGNSEPVKTLLVKIDTIRPTGGLVDPAPGSISANDMVLPLPVAAPYTVIVGDKTVTATGADGGSGVGKVDFVVDGILRSSATAAPYQWVWHAGDEAAGGHSLEVTVYDVAGNSVSSGVSVITVPNSLAGVQATLPS